MPTAAAAALAAPAAAALAAGAAPFAAAAMPSFQLQRRLRSAGNLVGRGQSRRDSSEWCVLQLLDDFQLSRSSFQGEWLDLRSLLRPVCLPCMLALLIRRCSMRDWAESMATALDHSPLFACGGHQHAEGWGWGGGVGGGV